jgi:hypothetical protein
MGKIKTVKHKINFAEKNLLKKKERLEKLNMKPIGFVINISEPKLQPQKRGII